MGSSSPVPVRVAHEVRGDGPPVVLIAGLGGDRGTWEGCLPHLVGFRVLRPDHRDVGGSHAPPGPLRIPDMAGDVIGAMDEAGMASAHVVGLSLGGVVAQELALTAPHRVSSLTLVSTWASPDAWLRRLMRDWARVAETWGLEPLWEQVLLWSFSPRLYATGGQRLAAIVDALPRDPAAVRAFVAQARAAVEHDTGERLRSVRAPTLILVGDQDVYTPVRFAQRLRDLIPGASLEVVPGVAHAFPIEDPGIFAQRLVAFARQVASTRGAATT